MGFKAKQGFCVYRVRVRRGGRKRPVHKVSTAAEQQNVDDTAQKQCLSWDLLICPARFRIITETVVAVGSKHQLGVGSADVCFDSLGSHTAVAKAEKGVTSTPSSVLTV